MSPTLLPVLTFLAVVTAVGGVCSLLSDLFLRDRSRVNQRVDDEFRKFQRTQARRSPLFKGLGPSLGELPAQADPEAGLRHRLDAMVEQSGLDLTTNRLLALSAAAGLALGAAVGLAQRGPAAGVVAALGGAAGPLVYVKRKRDARLEKLLGQLPDAFELMSRAVRAGQTMSQALLAVADEFQPPIAAEFSYCYEQQNLGLSSEMALRDLARRTGLLEVKIFVLALMVQQQTGGNLAELLDKLSGVIRERFRIRGQVKTLTAEGRIQAAVLLALPLVMFGFIFLFNRDYAAILLARPRIILGCFISEGVGALWIRKITNLEY